MVGIKNSYICNSINSYTCNYINNCRCNYKNTYICSWLAAARTLPSFLLFFYFFSFSGWGGAAWGGIITSCSSALHTFFALGSSLPVGWGGVGWDDNAMF